MDNPRIIQEKYDVGKNWKLINFSINTQETLFELLKKYYAAFTIMRNILVKLEYLKLRYIYHLNMQIKI